MQYSHTYYTRLHHHVQLVKMHSAGWYIWDIIGKQVVLLWQTWGYEQVLTLITGWLLEVRHYLQSSNCFKLFCRQPTLYISWDFIIFENQRYYWHHSISTVPHLSQITSSLDSRRLVLCCRIRWRVSSSFRQMIALGNCMRLWIQPVESLSWQVWHAQILLQTTLPFYAHHVFHHMQVTQNWFQEHSADFRYSVTHLKHTLTRFQSKYILDMVQTSINSMNPH